MIGVVVEGLIVGAAAGAAALALAIGTAKVIGGRAHAKVASHHAHTWGLEAFAREYARTRGLWLEDDQEFRRRFRAPLHGGPQFSMRGQMADGVDGRLVLWRDGSDPQTLERIWNLVLVPAPAGEVEAPDEKLHLWRAGDWLVVGEPSDDANRSLTALDSLRRRAAAPAAR